MKDNIENRSITSVLRNMPIGSKETFPIVQMNSVRTTIDRMQRMEKKIYKTITTYISIIVLRIS